MDCDCDCMCCAAGSRCARVLVLSKKDASDAARVLAHVGDQAGQRMVSLSISGSGSGFYRSSKPEPETDVTCKSCGENYTVTEYIARIILERKLDTRCEQCR